MNLFQNALESLDDNALKAYFRSIGENRFCPFLLPSEYCGVFRVSSYPLTGTLMEQQRQVFYYGLIHTEILRCDRRLRYSEKQAALLCENVVFDPVDRVPGGEGNGLFGWPHWILKTLYLPVGVLYGKFWVGEKDSARDGRPIPVPPVDFLSIRSPVKPVDERFFGKAPALINVYLTSEDDNKDVLAGLDLTRKSRRLVDDIRASCSCDLSKSQVQGWCESLEETELYAIALEKSREFITEY